MKSAVTTIALLVLAVAALILACIDQHQALVHSRANTEAALQAGQRAAEDADVLAEEARKLRASVLALTTDRNDTDSALEHQHQELAVCVARLVALESATKLRN
jgi:hypothetical protein